MWQRLHERGFISTRFYDETTSKSMRFASVYTEPFLPENPSRDIIRELFTGNPSRKVGKFLCFLFFFFFSVSLRVLPVTPLLSGVFMHRSFCACFLRIERVVEHSRIFN